MTYKNSRRISGICEDFLFKFVPRKRFNISSNYPRNIDREGATQYDEELAIKEELFYVFDTITRRTSEIWGIIGIMIKFVILEAA